VSVVARLVLVVLISTLSPSDAFSQSASPAPGTDYYVVRQSLAAQGNLPLTFPRGGAFDRCHHAEICAVYPEVITCSGTGRGYCRFAFRSPDGGYQVGTTAGERVDLMRLESISPATDSEVRMIENALAGRAW
jgi:hypothetical protein